MQVHRFERRQIIPRPLSEVFGFFARPENLARLTPPRLQFRMLTPSPIAMKEGAILDYSIRLLGVRMHWRTRIAAYDPPRRFQDEQLRGPYQFWMHTHEFEEIRGGVQMTDKVEYAVPLGPVGSLVHRLYVRRNLEAIFNFRSEAIRTIFPS
ncbi:SRPBCC family protein [Candidatus Sumerlaeota bacterium]|nr:SRPBCC family protein [Candidatus Sumerlaeota bacterium]